MQRGRKRESFKKMDENGITNEDEEDLEIGEWRVRLLLKTTLKQ